MHPALELFSVKIAWRNDHRLAISDRWHGAMPGAGWLTSKEIAAFKPVAAASLDAAVSFLVGDALSDTRERPRLLLCRTLRQNSAPSNWGLFLPIAWVAEFWYNAGITTRGVSKMDYDIQHSFDAYMSEIQEERKIDQDIANNTFSLGVFNGKEYIFSQVDGQYMLGVITPKKPAFTQLF